MKKNEEADLKIPPYSRKHGRRFGLKKYPENQRFLERGIGPEKN